jgi:hypothetical protein
MVVPDKAEQVADIIFDAIRADIGRLHAEMTGTRAVTGAFKPNSFGWPTRRTCKKRAPTCRQRSSGWRGDYLALFRLAGRAGDHGAALPATGRHS